MNNLTWKELCQLANDAGFGDAADDEMVMSYADLEVMQNVIWDDTVDCVACWAVIGRCDGYYTHIERHSDDERRLMILGRFWSLEKAIEFAGWATKIIYDAAFWAHAPVAANSPWETTL